MRTIGPFVDGYSLWWAVEGRNKKSITLDLRKPEGQELLKRLVAEADAVVENFQPGTLEGWGLGLRDAARDQPGADAVARASVYGQSGPVPRPSRPRPQRHRLWAGLLHLTGYPDRPPVRPGIIVSDYLTGIFNALGDHDRALRARPSRRRRRVAASGVRSRSRRPRARRQRPRSGARPGALRVDPAHPRAHRAGLRPPRRRARARGQPARATRRRSTTGRPPTASSSAVDRRRRRPLPAARAS